MAAPELVAVVVMLEGQFTTIEDCTTVTTKLQLVRVPQPSLAVTLTMVAPTGNVLPLGG